LPKSGQSRDPALQDPWWMHPWEERHPEAPGGGIPLHEALEVPVLGPASNSGAPAHNPMSIEAPNIDPGGSLLAELLNWRI
jgi:hypothetical protein